MSDNNEYDEDELLTPATELQEVDPYHDPDDPESDLMRWRSEWEAQEWAYEQAYEHVDIDPIWDYLPKDRIAEIGLIFIREGHEHARELRDEEITESISVITNEQLESWVDGQFRLFAGYKVHQDGSTLKEGDYGTWQDLRTAWEAGIYDQLTDSEKYYSLPEKGF